MYKRQGYRRIEDFVARAGTPEKTTWTPQFEQALNDDFSVPKALAEIHNHVREGNKALAAGDGARAAEIAGGVRAMAAVLGVDPGEWARAAGEGVGGASSSEAANKALDVLVTAELERRAAARAEKDWASADAVRDRLAAAGIDITDTADGPQWALKN